MMSGVWLVTLRCAWDSPQGRRGDDPRRWEIRDAQKRRLAGGRRAGEDGGEPRRLRRGRLWGGKEARTLQRETYPPNRASNTQHQHKMCTFVCRSIPFFSSIPTENKRIVVIFL